MLPFLTFLFCILLSSVQLPPCSGATAPLGIHHTSPHALEASEVLCDAQRRLTILSGRLVRAQVTGTGDPLFSCPLATRTRHGLWPWLPLPAPHSPPLSLDSIAGTFEERASLFAINRTFPRLQFTVTNTSAWCNVSVPDTGLEVAWRKTAADGGSTCPAPQRNTDAVCKGPCTRVPEYPNGAVATSAAECCLLCANVSLCSAYVWANSTRGPDAEAGINCWLLARGAVVGHRTSSDRALGRLDRPLAAGLTARGYLFPDRPGQSGQWAWAFGDPSAENLLGTLAPTPSTDLAGCCSNPGGQYDPRYPLEPGLLSRGGWSVVEDTSGLLDARGWAVEGARADFDLYLFACGLEYKACLAEFTQLSGGIALPPVAAMGVWWSRHWGSTAAGQPFGPMSESNILTEVVANYSARGIPLNVVVLDMEWHCK